MKIMKMVKIKNVKSEVESLRIEAILTKHEIDFRLDRFTESSFSNSFKSINGYGELYAFQKDLTEISRLLSIIEDPDSDHKNDDLFEEKNSYQSTKWLRITLLLFIISTAYLGYKYYSILETSNLSYKNDVLRAIWSSDNSTFLTYWKENSKLHSKQYDVNFNDLFEKIELFNKEGDLVKTYTDKDENGIYEIAKDYDLKRKVTTKYFDKNQDLFTDSLVNLKDQNVKRIFIDQNFDKKYDRVDILDSDLKLITQLSYQEYLERISDSRKDSIMNDNFTK